MAHHDGTDPVIHRNELFVLSWKIVGTLELFLEMVVF